MIKRPALTAGEAVPQPTSKARQNEAFLKELDIDVLARTLWGEARGEGVLGMEAVACVILNRVAEAQAKRTRWWGETLIEVCQKPYQFSCWNADDPNRTKVLAVDGKDPYFSTARRIARRAVYGLLQDCTGGATHYHAKGIRPYWTKGLTPLAEIGQHIFYREV